MTDKIDDQLVSSVAIGNALFLEDLVGEVGTCFEGKVLGQDESVVAIEQEVLDLDWIVSVADEDCLASATYWSHNSDVSLGGGFMRRKLL